MLEACWEEAASPLLHVLRSLWDGKSKSSSGSKGLQRLRLFFGYLPKQPPLLCGLLGASEVSSGVRSCWSVLWARQGSAFRSHRSGSLHQGMVRMVLG